MPLVVTSVPNLAQGVSQQPDNLRYPGQCDEQINAWSTVVEGLVKRPNTRWVKQFSTDSVFGELFTHFVKRDEDNKYCVQVYFDSFGATDPNVSVINVESGNQIPVSISATAQSYLRGITDPLKDLRALTVADYTFLVNKNKTVEKDTATLSQVPDDEAIIFVKLGDYEKAYSIYVDDSLIPPTPTFGSASHHNYNHTGHPPSTYISGPASGNDAKHADTSYIAKDLESCLIAELGSGGTLVGIASVGITTIGTGYGVAKGLPAGTLNSTKNNYKAELEITQSDSSGAVTASALGVCTVNSSGELTAVEMVRKGNNFDPANTFDFTVKEYIEVGGGVWFPNIFGSPTPPTFGTPVTFSRASLEIERNGSVIRLRSTDGPFKIRVEDGLANEGLGLAYREVTSITDLPKSCFKDFTVKVIGDADIDQDDYYVKFSTKEKEEFGEGTWIETVGWTSDGTATDELEAIPIKLDSETMPITLVPVLNVNGNISSFKLQSPEEDLNPTPPKVSGWRGRAAGNDETNPFPSFVGNKINDVFFFKNRLGFLTDNAVIFSEADEYYNFFRTTTQQLLDSAPIDVGLSHTKVAVLQHALPFQEKLMLFSDNSQFVLRGADILSPKTVAISPVTEYDISDGIAPLALGPYIYFPFNRGQHEGMYEYFVDNNTEVFEAEEITSQVPKYIRTSIKRMAGSASESMVLLQDNRDPKILYVYKYFWSGKEKIQSAWQKWEFANPINGFDFIDSTLYLILEGQRLVEMPVENALTDAGLDFTLLLDSRVDGQTCTVTYDDQTNRTTISNLPDGLLGTPSEFTVFTKGGSERRIISGNAVTKEVVIEGFLASYVKHNGTIYKCDTNHDASTSPEPGTIPGAFFWQVSTDVPNAPIWTTDAGFYNSDKYFFIGRPYDMLYRFSNQALKQPTERGGRSASDYTYQTIRNGSIEYADTGHFTVEVTPRFRDKYTYVYNPALLSSISTLDRFTPESGHFRFGVQCRPEEATIEVKSSSALPVKLLAAEFESMVASRSRRYGA
jgi:hypothetical protein